MKKNAGWLAENISSQIIQSKTNESYFSPKNDHI